MDIAFNFMLDYQMIKGYDCSRVDAVKLTSKQFNIVLCNLQSKNKLFYHQISLKIKNKLFNLLQ